jgi:hypothetical protein
MTGAAKRKAEEDCSDAAIHPGERDLKDDKAILRRMSPFVAPLRHAKPCDECRPSGVKRKQRGHRRTVAFDPKATSSVVGLRAVLLDLLAQFGMGRVSATQARRAENRRRHKVQGRGNRRFTFDGIHRELGVLCLQRLPRAAPSCALR